MRQDSKKELQRVETGIFSAEQRLKDVSDRLAQHQNQLQSFLRTLGLSELTEVTTLIDDLHFSRSVTLVENAEIHSRWGIESKATLLPPYTALLLQVLHSSARVASCLNCSLEEIPESTASLKIMLKKMEALCGDVVVPPLDLTRSAAIAALREIQIIVGTDSSSTDFPSGVVSAVATLRAKLEEALEQTKTKDHLLGVREDGIKRLIGSMMAVANALVPHSAVDHLDDNVHSVCTAIERASDYASRRIHQLEKVLGETQSAFSSAFFDISKAPEESLPASAERLAKELITLRGTATTLRTEVDALQRENDVFFARLPAMLKLLAPEKDPTGSISTETYSSANTATNHRSSDDSALLCQRLGRRIGQVLDELRRSQRQNSDAQEHLSVVSEVPTTNLAVAAASVVDKVQSLSATCTVHQNQIRNLESRLEEHRNEANRHAADYAKQIATISADCRASEERAKTAERKSAEAALLAEKETSKVKLFVDSLSLLLGVNRNQEQFNLDDRLLQHIVDCCVDLQHAQANLTQKLAESHQEKSNLQVDNENLKSTVRGLQERCELLGVQVEDAIHQREASDRILCNDIKLLNQDKETLTRDLLAVRRQSEASQFDLNNKIAQMDTALQRVADIINMQPNSTGGTNRHPSAVVEACHVRFRQLREENTILREELQKLQGERVVDLNDKKAEIEELSNQLQRITAERDDLVAKEENVLKQLEALLQDNLDTVSEWLPKGEYITVLSIADSSIAQIKRKQRLYEAANIRIQQLEMEVAKLSTQVHTCKEENTRLQQERQDALKEVTSAQRQHHASQIDAASVAAELQNLKSHIGETFAHCCDVAIRELGLKLGEFPDRSAVGQINGIRTVTGHIAHKYKHASLPDEVDQLRNVMTTTLNDERGRLQSANRALKLFEERVVPFAASAVNTSSAHVNVIADVGEGLHRVRQNITQAILQLGSLTGANTKEVSQHSDLVTISNGFLELAAEVTSKTTKLLSVCGTIADVHQVSHIDLSKSFADITKWAESVAEFDKVRDEESHLFVQKVADVLHSFGARDPLPAQAPLSRPRHHFQETSCSQDGHATRSLMEKQQLTLAGLSEFLNRLVSQQSVLTNDWQSLGDKCNRLLLEREGLEREREAVHEHVKELRRIVRRKVEDDKKAEEQIRQLDVHLESQARELALKYHADREAIQRRFAELRGVIHSTLRPTMEYEERYLRPRNESRSSSLSN
jgi:hypothetical protein